MRRTNSGFVQHVGKRKKRQQKGRTKRTGQNNATSPTSTPGGPAHHLTHPVPFSSSSRFRLWLAGYPLFLLVCVSDSLSRTAQWHCAREERRREEAEGREPVLR